MTYLVIKHSTVLGGAWGLGSTLEDAQKSARKAYRSDCSGKSEPEQVVEIDAPLCKIEIRAMPNGIQWYVLD